MVSASAPAPHPPPGLQALPLQLKDQQQKALAMNSLRLKAIDDRIGAHLLGVATLSSSELAHLVYAYARGIDFALSAGDVPTVAKEVPDVLRKVYELRKDPIIQSSILVLIISCKNACVKEWFQPTDTAYILRMANELSGNFCTSLGQAADESTVLGTILKVMPRYYPHLKFERMITSMEAKVGYDVLMSDFFIERNLPRDAKIETGPQFPTDITKMLKYGANIIQAVGYFNGMLANYIIAIAFVNDSTPLGAPKLDDYTQPVSVSPADSDVLEGPSRVSLNCPIRFYKKLEMMSSMSLCMLMDLGKLLQLKLINQIDTPVMPFSRLEIV
ncbi:hypothetical protein PR202_ga18043 [Eleusine coracana subsp. coracana]|uniref:Uncharacterized protein n=1 Tax=Eleusine coracana subsp. coracana TaxID=191504 RepID=A0AAV5CRU8_ELECO|nr:hypothetical protein PR202_ga18043 [Eleusine coracana subsp. coracana]